MTNTHSIKPYLVYTLTNSGLPSLDVSPEFYEDFNQGEERRPEHERNNAIGEILRLAAKELRESTIAQHLAGADDMFTMIAPDNLGDFIAKLVLGSDEHGELRTAIIVGAQNEMNRFTLHLSLADIMEQSGHELVVLAAKDSSSWQNG